MNGVIVTGSLIFWSLPARSEIVYRKLNDLAVENKRVLVRVDFNVPMVNGRITNDRRIREALPTIQELLKRKAAIILASHLGQPRTEEDKKLFSLAPIAQHLEQLLENKVHFANACRGEETKKKASALNAGEILLLENVRFESGETKNDSTLAREWATYADYYVNDAFGTCHRAHASVAAITEFLPAAAGRLVEKELHHMIPVMKHPTQPFVVVLGGSKLSTKLKLLEKLLEKANHVLIGGAMVFTFYRAKGLHTGTSLVETEFVSKAKELLNSKKIILPIDVVVSESIDGTKGGKTVLENSIPQNMMGVDIGQASIEVFRKYLSSAKTVLWNGPLGVFETPEFSKGTKEIAKILAGLTAITIVGGGDSAAAIGELGLEEQMTHVSTGGGATLEFFESGTLPALECLEKNMARFP